MKKRIDAVKNKVKQERKGRQKLVNLKKTKRIKRKKEREDVVNVCGEAKSSSQ